LSDWKKCKVREKGKVDKSGKHANEVEPIEAKTGPGGGYVVGTKPQFVNYN
jgi:hypothetical protein